MLADTCQNILSAEAKWHFDLLNAVAVVVDFNDSRTAGTPNWSNSQKKILYFVKVYNLQDQAVELEVPVEKYPSSVNLNTKTTRTWTRISTAVSRFSFKHWN